MAAAQLAHGALEAPWPQASWFSVTRRSLVVAAFVAFALLTGRLDTAVYAAFGALQIGLVETVVPLRSLLRQSALTVAGLVSVAFAASILSGTWWTVPLLAAVAFLHGASTSAGPIPRAVGIGALAMGVIFAGVDADPLEATMWLAVGAIAQVLSAILLWKRERGLAIRILLANAVRSTERIARGEHATGVDSNAASAQIDVALDTIASSGIPNQDAATRVARAINDVRRNLIAWLELERPGLGQRLGVSARLRTCIQELSEAPGPRRPEPRTVSSRMWPVGNYLAMTIGELQAAISRLPQPDPQPRPVGTVSDWSGLRAMRIGSPQFLHGLRMALALAIAQSLAVVLPLDHSFWIPLTCVFVVKPDWSFTVVRSVARLGGNVLAVLVVPAVTFVLGYQGPANAIAAFVISAIAFRYFSGNYVLGSFGIAGTILLLDALLNHDPRLYLDRVIATAIGAIVAVGVSALIPSWRSGQAVRLVDDTVVGLAVWARAVTQAVQDPRHHSQEELQALGERQRVNLIALRPAVDAALVEPRPAADPRCLAAVVDAAARAHLCLLALTFEARLRREAGEPGLDIRAHAEAADASFGAAADTLSQHLPAYASGPVEVTAPSAAEELAVELETVHLAEAAADLADAVAWLRTSTSAR